MSEEEFEKCEEVTNSRFIEMETNIINGYDPLEVQRSHSTVQIASRNNNLTKVCLGALSSSIRGEKHGGHQSKNISSTYMHLMCMFYMPSTPTQQGASTK